MNWKRFGESFKSATGVSVAAVLVLFATYGKQLIDAALALPALYKAYAAALPFGLWSATMGTAVSTLFHLFARSWHKRSLAIEIATIILGGTVVVLQLPDKSPATIVNGIVVGAVAGGLGLFLAKVIRAVSRGDKDESRPNPPLPESD